MSSRFDWNTLISNMLLMGSTLNTPGWTLKYEIVGYAMIPFAFLTVSVKGPAKLLAFTILVTAYFFMSQEWSSWTRMSSGFATGFVAYYAYREIGETRMRSAVVQGLAVAAVISMIAGGVKLRPMTERR